MLSLDTISYTADIFVFSAAICFSTFSIGLKISFMKSTAGLCGCFLSSTLYTVSLPITITQLQEETANPPCIGGIGQQQQRACKHCPAKDARIMELEELVRAHTLIKSAEELMRRSTDGYQHFEFSVPSEPIRRHIVYFNGNSQYECTYRKRYIKYDNVCHLNDKRDVRREIQTNG